MSASSVLFRRSLNSCIVRRHVRNFSGEASQDHARTAVHFIGEDRYGSREYVLLPVEQTLDDLKADPKLKLASIHAHRNIVFGASVDRQGDDMIDLCGPLLDAALTDASEPGEQPQAIASLVGLCIWVARGINGEEESAALKSLENDDTAYEAVKAIATGIARPGHSVVGAGTYRDGKAGWEALATEFVQLEKSDEARLYQSRGGELVAIEHLADQSEAYLRSAGGAMARFFFV